MNRIKKLTLSLCFILLLCIILNTTSNIFERKNSALRFSEFWENPGEYDIWFMGTSHVFCAIQPMELWNQYGIRSYDLAAPSSQMPQIYWTMMCALQYSQPKIIVLDTYKIYLNEKHQDNKGIIHIGLDSIPLSCMKIKGIFDIFNTSEDRFEYICNFSIYHNRWEELTKNDFKVQPPTTNGARFINDVVDNSDFQNIAKEDMSDTDTVGFVYLKKIIEECQKREIELVLTELPFCSTQKIQRAMNAVPKVAEEYDLVCLNITYEKGLLDYGVDFGDEAHVNLFGAGKITEYIGDYLSKNYDLTDYRKSTKVSEKWNADYKSYLQLWLRKMRKTNKIESYVQWLLNDRYTCYMYKQKEPQGLLEKEIAQLENITYISLEDAEERMGREIEGEYALFVENSNGKVVDTAVFKDGKRN